MPAPAFRDCAKAGILPILVLGECAPPKAARLLARIEEDLPVMTRALRRLSIVATALLLGAGMAWAQSVTRYPKQPSGFVEATYTTQSWLANSRQTGGGDLDRVNVVFFEVPDSLSSTIYFAVKDPGSNGTIGTFPDYNAASGNETTFTLLGGEAAFTGSNSRLTYYATTSNAYQGEVLDSFSRSNETDADLAADSGWKYFAGVSPSQGEHIGNKYYFKVVVEVSTDDNLSYKNGYQLDASFSPAGVPGGIDEGFSFAYDACIVLQDRAALDANPNWRFYPFVPDDVAAANYVGSHNFDFDDGASTPHTSIRVFRKTNAESGTVADDTCALSGEDEWVDDYLQVSSATQVNGTWRCDIYEGNVAITGWNLAEVRFSRSTDQTADNGNDAYLRMYSAYYAPPAPYRATVEAADGQAISNGTDLELVTFQIVAADGSPVPYVRNLYVTANLGATIDSASTSAAAGSVNAAAYLLATDGNGMGWVKVKRATVGSSAISAYWDGTGSSSSFGSASYASASVSFVANPDPTISSAANFGAAVGAASTAIPNIDLGNSPATSNFTMANGLRIRIPSSLDCSFDTGATPTLTPGAGSGTATVASVAAKLLTINVTADFTAGQTLAISGLQLQSFLSASSGSLELSWDGGLSYSAFDDKTYTVTGSAPSIVSRQTADLDADGYIDAVKITFSESVDDGTITAGAAGFAIAGASGLAFASTTNGDVANNSYIYITFTDGVLASDATPAVSYDASVGNITDNDTVAKELPTTAAAAAADKAGPAILSARTITTTSVELSFSEAVADASLAAADFILAGFTSTTVSSVSTGSAANDAVVLLNLAAANGVDETGTVAFSAVGVAYDAAGAASTQPSAQTVAVADGVPASPSIVSRETYDADADGSLDRIRLLFSAAMSDATALAAEFSVTGYTVASIATGATPNDAELYLVLTELAPGDTGATPGIRYTGSALRSALGIYAVAEGAAVAPVDKAGPAIIAASTYTTGSVQLTFSEAVSDASLAGPDFTFSGFTTGAANASGVSVSTGGTADDATAIVSLAATIGSNETGFVRLAAAGRVSDLAGAASAQTANVSVTDGIPVDAEATSFETADADADGHIDRLVVNFNKAVNVVDTNGAADGFPAIAVAGYAIADADYAASGVMSLSLVLTELGTGDTGATPSVTLTASAAIVDASTAAQVATLTANAADKAGPAVLSASTLTTTSVQLVFSEALSDSSLSGADFVFSGFATTAANAPGLSVSTGATANDATVVVGLASAIGVTETGSVRLAAASRVADAAGLYNTQVATVAVTDGLPDVAVISARGTADADADGQIDRIRLVFSNSVQDATVVAAQFTVTGYTVSGYSTGATANDAEIYLVLTESGSSDTDATPAVQYTGASLLDALGGAVAAEGSATAAADEAGPAIVSASTLTRTTVQVSFSEPLSDASLAASDFSFAGFATVAANATALAASTGATANDDAIVLTFAAAIGGDETGTVRFAGAGKVADAAGAANTQVSAVAVADGIPAGAAITSCTTGDADGDGHIDRLTIAFDRAVTVTDGSAADGLPGFTVTGYAIANANYAALNVTSLVLTLTELAAFDTNATPAVAFTNTGNVIDTATAVPAQDRAAAAATDGAGPAIASARLASATTVQVTFSEDVDDGSLAGADFVFSGFSVGGANAAGTAVGTGGSADDEIVVVTLAAAVLGSDAGGLVALSAAGVVLDSGGNASAGTGTTSIASLVFHWKTAPGSADWSDPANWVEGYVPDANTLVVIPTGASPCPVLDVAAAAYSLSLAASDATLELGNFSIAVGAGGLDNAGVIIVSGTGGIDKTDTDSGAFRYTAVRDLIAFTGSDYHDLEIQAAVTQAEETVVAGATTITIGAAADLSLIDPDNDFATVAIASARDVALRDVNAISLGACVVGNDLSVIAGGAIIDTDTLSVTGDASFVTRLDGGASITLNDDGLGGYSNNFGSLVLRTMNTAGLAAAAGAIEAYENSATVLNGIQTLGAATIQSAGDLSDGGALSAASLSATAVGGIVLDDANAIGSISLSNSGSGLVTFTGNTAATLTVSSVAQSAAAAVTIGSTGAIDIPAAGTGIVCSAVGAANVSVTASGALTVSDVVTASGAGTVTLSSATIAIGAAVTGNGGINLYPNADGVGIELNNGDTAFSLDETELQYLASTGTVTIGAASGTGSANAINIASAGAINLTGESFNLSLEGAGSAIAFNTTAAGGLSLASGRTLTLAAGGAITSPGAGTSDISIAGTSILDLSSATSAGSLADPLRIAAATLRAPVSAGDLYISATGALVLGDGTRAVSAADGSIGITATGALTLGADLATTAGDLTARPVDLSGASVALGNYDIAAANDAQIDIESTAAGITTTGGVAGSAGSASLVVLTAATSVGTAGTPIQTDAAVISATASAGGVFVNDASALSLGSISATGGAIAITTTSGAIDVTNAVATTGAYNLSVTAGGGAAVTISYGTAPQLKSAGATLSLGSPVTVANAVTAVLVGDEIELSGNLSAGGATSRIAFEPATANLPIMVAGTTAAGRLDLTAAEMGLIQNGFDQVRIGRSDGTGLVTINAITVSDPLVVQSAGALGAIAVAGLITGSGNASVDLNAGTGGISLGANIVTAGNAITLEDVSHNALTLAADVILDATNAGAVATGAAITLNGPVNGSAADARSLTVRTGQATWTMDQAIGATNRLVSFTLRADGVALNAGAGIRAQTINLYTATPATTTIGLGGAAGIFNLDDTELGYLSGFTSLYVGQTTFQAGAIAVQTISNPSAGSALYLYSDSGTGGISLADDGANPAIAWGAGALTLGAGSGGISVSSAANNGFAELATTGLVTLASAGAIGDAAGDRLELAGMPSSVVVTNAPGGAYLRGLAAMSLGAVATGGGDLYADTSAGYLRLGGAVACGAGSADLGAAAEIRLAVASPTVVLSAAGARFRSPVVLYATSIVTTGTTVQQYDLAIDSDALATARGLTLNAGTGGIDANVVIGTGTGAADPRLASFSATATGGTVSLGSVYTTGLQSVAGAGIGLNAGTHRATTAAATITYTGPVTLAGGTVNVTTNNGNIDFDTAATTVDGAQDLILTAGTGAVTLDGVVGTSAGDANNLTSFSIVTSASATLGSVFTSGPQSVTGTAITLNAGSHVSTDGLNAGNITFAGPVTLNGIVSVTTTDSAIEFTGIVNGSFDLSLNAQAVTATNGNVTMGGIVGTSAGHANNLDSFVVANGNTIYLHQVFTSGAQSVTGAAITLYAGSYVSTLATGNAGNITFTGPVTLAGIVGVTTTNSAIEFADEVNGSFDLTLNAQAVTLANGNVTMGDIVGTSAGHANNLDSFVVTNGNAVSLHQVFTGGNQTVTGAAITLNAGAYQSATLGGGIRYTGPVTLAGGAVNVTTNGGNIDFDTAATTVNGAQDLILTAGAGAVGMDGVVGTSAASAARLASFSIVSSASASLGSVFSSGAQSVASAAITLNAGSHVSTLATGNAGNITFTGPVTLAGIVGVTTANSAIEFTQTVNGSFDLSLNAQAVTLANGNVTMGGIVGTSALSANRLASFVVTNGNTVSLRQVFTIGSQTVTGAAITLNAGDYTATGAGAAIGFTGPASLVGGAVAITASAGAGSVSFATAASTIDGAQGLTLTAGTGGIALAGAIGAGTALGSLSLSSAGNIAVADIGASGSDGVSATIGATASGAGYIALNGRYYRTGGAQTWTASSAATGGLRFVGAAGAGQWSAGGAGISLPATDLYVDANGLALDLLCDLSCRRFVFYRGTLDLNANTIAASGDFAVFGASYDPIDYDFETNYNTRFAYYEAASLAYFPGGGVYSSLPAGTQYAGHFRNLAETLDIAPNAAFATLAGATIDVGGDFYANGAVLNPAANWSLANADNGAANPVYNGTAAVSAAQWGTPYSVVFNTTIGYCQADYPVNAAVESVEFNNGVTAGTANANVFFERPELHAAWTVFDDVLYVEFTDGSGTAMPIWNANTEIWDAVNGGGIGFNGGAAQFLGAYQDPGCTIPLSGVTASLDHFYLKTNPANAAERWNTDATGLSAGAAASTDRGRPGLAPAHRTTVPDITFLKGALYSADGKTMIRPSDDYTSPGAVVFTRYTATADRCRPVISALRTGQEEHVAPSGAQQAYDSHNYFEIDWSEPVDLGTLAGGTDYANLRSETAFASYGGDYTGSGTATLEGYFTVSGSITRGARPNVDTTTPSQSANSLYRAAATPQRLRLYIAGWSEDGTSLDPDWTWYWPGWVDDLATPSGAITVLENLAIHDRAATPNPVEPTGSAADAPTVAFYSNNYRTVKATISVDSAESAGLTYGAWDVDPPSLALVRSNADWGTITAAEAMPLDSDSNTYIDRVELHFIDNDAQEAHWASMRGWIPVADAVVISGALGSYTYVDVPPDARGGARSSRPLGIGPESLGGVRDATLGATALAAFSFCDADVGSYTNSYNLQFLSYVISKLYDASSINAGDDPYLAITLDDTAGGYSWNTQTDLLLSYNEAGCVTDLAGNRLRSFSGLAAVSISPPRFRLALAVADSDQRRVYIQFSKDMELDTIVAQSAASLASDYFQFSDGTIEPVSAQRVSASSATELWLTVSRNLTAFDLYNVTMNAITQSVVDPISGATIAGSYVTDAVGNALLPTETHSVSDFGLNVLNMSAATDGLHETDEPELAAGETALPASALGALRTFDGSGSLLDRDIVLYSLLNPSGGLGTGLSLQLHYDVNPAASYAPFVSVTGRRASLGTPWLPGILSGYNLVANSAARSLSPFFVGTAPSMLRNFRLPGSDSEIVAGAEVGFLFSYGGKYCLRAADPDDPRQYDLYRFNIKAVRQQRGGVTILNNVINPTTGERTALQVVLDEAGPMTATVFTLDGDVVKRLYNDRQAAGTYTYYWDGKNNAGKPVARGIYFIRVVAKGIDEIRKVLVVR